MSTIQDRFEFSSVTPLHWVAVVLALVSATVHLLYATVGPLDGNVGMLSVSFVLAFGGYVGAVVLFLLDYRRRLLYLVGVPYTGFQIVAWLGYVATGKIGVDAYAMVDKPAQLTLIVVLIILYRRES